MSAMSSSPTATANGDASAASIFRTPSASRTRRGEQSATMWSISRLAYRGFTGTAAAPARWAATYPTANSTASAVCITSATRSPLRTPASAMPRAAASARSFHSPYVRRPRVSTSMATRSPNRSARSATSSGIRTGGLSSGFAMAASPLLVGILYDFPQHDSGASFEEAVRQGLQEVELDRSVELVPRQAAGLPGGTAHDVRRNFDELVDAGVLAI